MVSKKWAGIIPVLTVILAVLCLAAPAMAATWVVNPDGTGDFTTIQAALDSEWTSGDTIEIAYAVYMEPVAVDADGGALTITGIPSPAGDLPVIDGMDGAVELPGLVDGDYGCGECSMFLYNGNFDVSSLSVTNASNNGLVVYSGDSVEITDVEATGNGGHGVNIRSCGEVVLDGILATENGWSGIQMGSYSTSIQGTDLICTGNGWDGLMVRGREGVELTSVISAQNGYRGVTVWAGNGVIISEICVTDNRNDGLMVQGHGATVLEMSDVTSTGNGGDGVVVNGFADFSVSDMEINGNGADLELPPALLAERDTGVGLCYAECANGDFDSDADCMEMTADAVMQETGVVHDLRHDGNGLFVVKCVNGTIDGVDAMNNAAVGIVVDATGDVVISDSTADANGYLGILTMSVSDEYPLCADLISDIGTDTDTDEMTDALETFFTGMTELVANSTVVSEDEFMLGEGIFIFVENVTEDGPDVTLTSVCATENGYAGIGILAPYVNATDITTDGNGVSPTDVAGTLAGAGIVGASFVGEYSGVDAADNGGAGMAAASLLLDIEDAVFTRNGAEAYSDIHGPLFQTGLLTVSLVNVFSGVYSLENAGSGIIMTSVITMCDECSASGNEYGGIVAADPLSLGLAALFAHSDLSVVLDSADISEEDRFYLESLSTPAMQDVMTCYGETDTFSASSVAKIEIDDVTEEDVAVLIKMLHQYMALSGCYMMNSAADENGLFGMAVVYPNVATYGFSADGNGNGSGSPLEALLGTGIFGLYLTGDFYKTSVSENTGAGMVTVGVISEYTEVMADDNGYAGIVTIDPVTLAAAALGYFVVLDASGAEVDMTAADTTVVTDLEMHADIAESAVVQEIVSTYYTGAPAGDLTMDAVIIPGDGMDILLEHIELYFENAGVYARDVSASGNGYPGFVAIAPNVMMDGVTADKNGALNDDESEIIALAAGSGIIGLSIVGDYEDITASGNTGAGIATAGVVTEMSACEADDNGVGVVSLFIVGDYTEIGADENAISGIVLAGINGTLTNSAAAENAGPGIVCVDPVAAALMYLVFTPAATASGTVDSIDGVDASFEYETGTVSPETLALLLQLSGSTNSVSSVSGDSETETAWSLIEWTIAHISSYEGDITELNETEIMDLVLTHYLTGAGFSVSDVTADENGWQGVVVLSPSIAVEGVSADGNGYHGVSVISPWKAVDAFGWVHPAEPLGAERILVQDIYVESNDGAGLAVSGANGGGVTNVYASGNLFGLLLGDSDSLMVSDTTFETNWGASVMCAGSELSSLVPTGLFLPSGALTDPTGSCDNVFTYTVVDSGIALLPNSSCNVFNDTFFDESEEISADISGEGFVLLYSTSGTWSPVLPETAPWVHMAECGIGVMGVGGHNTTVNVTYDYGHGFPIAEGEMLYPQWTVNATTLWDSWRFNQVENDKNAMTVGPMEVPVCCPASVPSGQFADVMYIAPFWMEERSDDDSGHDIFMESLAENKEAGYIGPDGVFIPYATEEAPLEETGDGTGDGAGDDTGDDSGDETSAPQQSGGESDGSASGQAGAPGVTATATAAATTPVPTTTPAGVAPVIGALGILGVLAVIRRR